jgi:hypothetical protein
MVAALWDTRTATLQSFVVEQAAAGPLIAAAMV